MNIYTKTPMSVLSKWTHLPPVLNGFIGILFLAMIFIPTIVFSQWSGDPTVNNLISDASNDQVNTASVSDGNGGAIIAWQDYRRGNYDIYAQRINANGTVQWTTNGVVICSMDSDQVSPVIISDGSGGAIIAWQDKRNGSFDIYTQRINSNGALQWNPSAGDSVCVVVFDQVNIAMVSDGNGGALLTWEDYRSNAGPGLADVYAQKLNSSGVTQWIPNGVGVCIQAAAQYGPKIISDGAGGAFITWYDQRAGNFDIYAQRLNPIGGLVGITNGVAVCTSGTDQTHPDICTDGAGGAIIVWQDFRSTTSIDIWVQAMSPAVAIRWPVDGIVMNNNVAYDQINPKLVSDGVGGAMMTWEDFRTGTTSDIYAQRVDSTGVVATGWNVNGVAICVSANNQSKPNIISDGNHGAIITWVDKRDSATNGGTSDIYAAQITGAFALPWTPDGVPVCTADSTQSNPAVVSDGTGGAIAAWQDNRSGNYDIFASRINFGNGVLADGEIHGAKFIDADGNGIWDGSEFGLSDWTVKAVSATDTFFTTTGSDGGAYSFTGLKPGTYKVSEVQELGYHQTFPRGSGTYTVVVSVGSIATGRNFGNQPIPGIGGMKFNDLNGNGAKDNGEPGLLNWQIVLTAIPTTTNPRGFGFTADTTLTDVTGNYYFTGVPNGTYTVREIQQAGWVQTTANPDVITYTGGLSVTNVNFGNFRTPSISGKKWFDTNGNRVIDETETYLSGWVIMAQKSTTIKLDTTDVNGDYMFTFGQGETGTWVVSEVMQNGWSQTYPTGGTFSINVVSNLDATGINFGNAQPGSIAGSKYKDDAGDSTTVDDVKLSGWVIQLFKDSVKIASTTTDVNGNYLFTNVLPGTSVVQESLQTGWAQTVPKPSSSIGAIPATNAGPRAYQINVVSSGIVTGIDFANFQLGSVSGTKFHDIDGDSIKDAGEPGLAGRVLQLLKGATVVASDTSDGTGAYSFTGLPPGPYTLKEVIPTNWYQTMPATAGYTITFTSGGSVTGKNFGNAQYGSISGKKFYDHDSTGTFDANCEVYSAGHKIVLVGTHIAPETTVTDANGDFTFDPIPADNYTVKEAPTTLWAQTFPAHGNPYAIQLLSGVDTTGFVFGNFFLPDSGKYRTFTIIDYNKTSKFRAKNGYAKAVNAGNVRDTVYVNRGFDSPDGFMLMGVPRPDSALYYGWYQDSLDVLHPYKPNAVKAWLYNISVVKLVRAVKLPGKPLVPRRPTNFITAIGRHRAESEIGNSMTYGQAYFLTFLTNIAASDLGVTPPGFGDLVYSCAKNSNFSDSILVGKSLREIAYFWDTVLTMGRIVRGPHDTVYRYDRSILKVLDSFALRLNSSFSNPLASAKVDTFSTKPLKVKGFKALYKVPYLRNAPNPLRQFHHVENRLAATAVPAVYNLEQNYPNPFNPTTTIEFELKQQSKVILKIYNLLGQEVATIIDGQDYDEGTQMVQFDATDFSSGIYFYRLDASGIDEHGQKFNFTKVKKMVLMK